MYKLNLCMFQHLYKISIFISIILEQVINDYMKSSVYIYIYIHSHIYSYIQIYIHIYLFKEYEFLMRYKARTIEFTTLNNSTFFSIIKELCNQYQPSHTPSPESFLRHFIISKRYSYPHCYSLHIYSQSSSSRQPLTYSQFLCSCLIQAFDINEMTK